MKGVETEYGNIGGHHTYESFPANDGYLSHKHQEGQLQRPAPDPSTLFRDGAHDTHGVLPL